MLKADRLAFTYPGATRRYELTFTAASGEITAISGQSGSGKSTLLDHVIYQGLLAQRHHLVEDAAQIARIECDLPLGDIVLVDQSPLSRTPRSNPALYAEAWDRIRELFAATPAAQAAGFSAASFSFNGGDGRCDHCQGLGYERVDQWDNPDKRCTIPFHPGHSLEGYHGFHFRLRP